MTRDERIDRACAAYVASTEPGTTHRDGIEAALDAALADVSGLDGLDTLARRIGAGDDYADHLAGRTTEQAQEIDALRADRDRLREALRWVALPGGSTEGYDPAREKARAVLRESEADE